MAVILSVLPILAFATTGFGASCQATYHCYSVSELSNGQPTIGIFGTWQNANMVTGSALHINTTVWLETTYPNSWVEVGLVTCRTDVASCGAGTGGYAAYWADYSGGAQVVMWTQGVPLDGTTHNYEIQQNSHTNWWNVYRDWNFVGTSTSQNAWQSCSDHTSCNSAGGEIQIDNIYGPDPTQSTGGFDLYLQSKTPGTGVWYSWPVHTYLTDSPCGPNPSGYCLNGYPYYPQEWSWNKP